MSSLPAADPAPVICDATYEPVPDNRRNATHTCARPAGHEGAHACPICRKLWDRPRAEEIT